MPCQLLNPVLTETQGGAKSEFAASLNNNLSPTDAEVESKLRDSMVFMN